MVVQLKRLEKVLEQSLADGKSDQLDSAVDAFLNENEDISSADSSRLHDVLYRIWKGLAPKRSSIELEPEYSLSPVTSGTVEVQPMSPHDESGLPNNPLVLFLNASIRLAPCLINKDQLQDWWRALATFAIDSTGHPLDVVDRSQTFISGVLTSSFYMYADPSSANHFADIAAMYGQNVIDIYVNKWFLPNSVDCPPPANITDERRRFSLLNCRTMFGRFARKDNKMAFDQINRYFVMSEHRVDVLDLVVEYLSESQNSKLFRIYDSPFFESLLVCLERDNSRLVSQSAVTALSMLLVHVCDKLVPTGALFRIYGVFGRVCSWQPSVFNADNETNDENIDETNEDTDTEAVVTQPESKDSRDTSHSSQKSRQTQESKDFSKNAIPMGDTDTSSVLRKKWIPAEVEDDTLVTPDGEIDLEISVKVITLFTFLYGLFPINTLKFCRHCDEYFKAHKYERAFSDYWSRFMVTRKAERIVRQFRVDPLLVLGSEETELSGSVERFQEVGSVLGLTSICTSRRIVQIDDDDEQTTNDDTAAGNVKHAAVSNIKHEVDEIAKNSYEPQPSSRLETTELTTERASPDPSSAPATQSQSPDKEQIKNKPSGKFRKHATAFDHHLGEHRKAFQMHAADSVGHWHRELLLIRTELAFANFSRDMSEQRALRWQKRAADRMISLSKTESLTRENAALRCRVTSLENEVNRAVRSARNIMRERSAYEAKSLERNREFRDKIRELEENILDFQKQTDMAKWELNAAEERATEVRNEAAKTDEQIKLLRNDLDAANRSASAPGNNGNQESSSLSDELSLKEKQITKLEAKLSALTWSMQQLERDHAENIRALKEEVETAQANYAQVKAEESRKLRAHRGDRTASAAAQAEEKDRRRNSRLQNEELTRHCMASEQELRARKVHEEERINELQAALSSSTPYSSHSSPSENRFRGRGGAQGIPHLK